MYRKMIASVCLAILILSIVGCHNTDPATPNSSESTSQPDVSTSSTPPTTSQGTDATLPPESQETEETVTIPTGDHEMTPDPTDPTVPTDPTQPTDPSEPPTQPTEPSEPATESTGTEPETTVPEPTNPETTEPKVPDCESTPVEPETTGPQQTEHVHDYAVSEIVEPDCESGGYSVFTCSCGDYYKSNETAAVGHRYTHKVTAPTCTSKGYTTHTCSSCGNSYKDSSTAALGHSYTKKVTAPTCTEGGYTAYTCSACGDYYKSDSTSAVGHSYTKQVIAPTCNSEGYTIYTCSSCGNYYTADEVSANGHSWSEWKVTKEATASKEGERTRNCIFCSAMETEAIPVVTIKLEPWDPATDEEAEIARLFGEYINQFRAEDGSTQLTFLPGMTKVAQYRSRQLVTNFEHDTTDKREALAYYKYGKWIDPADYGDPDGVGYYSSNTSEAIGKTNHTGSAEEIAYELARACRDSAGHWRYVGSSEYSYSGVGVAYSNGEWYLCIMVGTVNYG